MKIYYKNIVVISLAIFFACGQKDNGAASRLDAARKLYTEKQYQLAKQEIDSIKILHPKSYDEIRAGLAFLDTIRRAENAKIITECDSLITLYEPEIAKVKTAFSFQKNKEYQETGSYIPKESVSGGMISQTTLRSGVAEDGTLYIESVFVGPKQKHNRIKISTKDGSFAQSQPVTDDGLNYRFSNMGKEYEVIRFVGASENGIGKFIYVNSQTPLTVTLDGQSKYSYQISQSVKSAIGKSVQLSTIMLQMDSLKTAKEKAEFHIYYLDNKKNKGSEEIVE